MRLNKVAAIIFALFCISGSSIAQKATQATSTIQGRVADSVGGIEGTLIEIDGTGGNFVVPTNSEGIYTRKVAPGTYRLSVKPSQWDPAYRLFKRAQFRILPGEVKEIDISPYSGVDYCSSGGDRVVNVRARNITPVGYFAAKAPRYADYSVMTPAGETELMIEYCEKKPQKDSIRFRSVVVSFDQSTIYADAAILYPETHLLKVLDKEIQLVVRNDHSVVSDLSLSFNGANVYFDVPKGFTSLLKTNGLIAQGPRSFEITVDRASLGHFFYQDKEKDFALRLNPNSLLYVKTISPNVVTLSGLGRLSGPGAPGGDGYSNFSATLEASTNGSATLTMEIPQLSYKQIEHTPPNAFIISREKDLYEVTDPKFTQKGVKTTAMTWP